jgi:hypothetical protein
LLVLVVGDGDAGDEGRSRGDDQARGGDEGEPSGRSGHHRWRDHFFFFGIPAAGGLSGLTYVDCCVVYTTGLLTNLVAAGSAERVQERLLLRERVLVQTNSAQELGLRVAARELTEIAHRAERRG